MNSVAWDVAKSHNIVSKVAFNLISQLTDLYVYQDRIAKLEDEIGEILLDYNSRDINKAHVTLIKDNYKAWAYDWAPYLLKKYDAPVGLLDAEK